MPFQGRESGRSEGQIFGVHHYDKLYPSNRPGSTRLSRPEPCKYLLCLVEDSTHDLDLAILIALARVVLALVDADSINL